jgi:hypothetical protein
VSTRHFRLLRFGSFPSEVSTEKYHLCVVSVIVGLCVVPGGCGAAPAPEASAAVEGPEAVVTNFYRWYTGYPGNPMVGRAYRSNEYLTGELIEKVDGIIDSFDRGGYDPFLCAQDVPGEFAVEDAAVSGEEASVVVHGVWNPGTQYESMTGPESQGRTFHFPTQLCPFCTLSHYSFSQLTHFFYRFELFSMLYWGLDSSPAVDMETRPTGKERARFCEVTCARYRGVLT